MTHVCRTVRPISPFAARIACQVNFVAFPVVPFTGAERVVLRSAEGCVRDQVKYFCLFHAARLELLASSASSGLESFSALNAPDEGIAPGWFAQKSAKRSRTAA